MDGAGETQLESRLHASVTPLAQKQGPQKEPGTRPASVTAAFRSWGQKEPWGWPATKSSPGAAPKKELESSCIALKLAWDRKDQSPPLQELSSDAHREHHHKAYV